MPVWGDVLLDTILVGFFAILWFKVLKSAIRSKRVEAWIVGDRGFTWWTYFIACRRAFNREYDQFAYSYQAYRGPAEWKKAMRLTRLLNERRKRERQVWPFINR